MHCSKYLNFSVAGQSVQIIFNVSLEKNIIIFNKILSMNRLSTTNLEHGTEDQLLSWIYDFEIGG